MCLVSFVLFRFIMFSVPKKTGYMHQEKTIRTNQVYILKPLYLPNVANSCVGVMWQRIKFPEITSSLQMNQFARNIFILIIHWHGKYCSEFHVIVLTFL